MGIGALQRRLDEATSLAPGSDFSLRVLWVAPVVCLGVLLTLGLVLQPFPELFRLVMHSEGGVVENLVVILALTGAVMALRLVGASGQPALLRLWYGLFFLMLVFLAGEETSWGQHWFGWATPESFAALNEQGETNLHNLPIDWIEDAPKTLVIVTMMLAGGLAPLFIAFTGSGLHLPMWLMAIWPSAALWPTTAVYVGLRIVERGIAATMDVSSWGLHFRPLREGIEVFIALFLFLYLWSQWRRLRAARAAAA
ncbi:MAG: hypothetical protein EON91_02125 [Brevundimonas sp.]|uniref:hypothetical protein n=1 Tax=Brevundimonas sp. TaxID=1871086 RepID=UPI00121E3326|nr:hypothetical protein [Brevundimonas sp.]RZJ19183.1 MAG: hypothetical protein EON91_02125 [Brevundimonas sp.]